MRSEKLLHEIGNIDAKYVLSAENAVRDPSAVKVRKPVFAKAWQWAMVPAMAAMVIGVVVVNNFGVNSPNNNTVPIMQMDNVIPNQDIVPLNDGLTRSLDLAPASGSGVEESGIEIVGDNQTKVSVDSEIPLTWTETQRVEISNLRLQTAAENLGLPNYYAKDNHSIVLNLGDSSSCPPVVNNITLTNDGHLNVVLETNMRACTRDLVEYSILIESVEELPAITEATIFNGFNTIDMISSPGFVD